MSAPRLQTTVLKPHPQARNNAVRSISVRVCRLEESALKVSYELQGDLDRLRIPQPGQTRIADQLWQHTCFELFVKSREGSAYHELNLSPSSEWAAYSFIRYRERVPLDYGPPSVSIAVSAAAGSLGLDASIDVAALSPRYASEPLMLGISAVIEAGDGTLSYWAAAHPEGKPDFHHRDAFVMELDEIRN